MYKHVCDTCTSRLPICALFGLTPTMLTTSNRCKCKIITPTLDNMSTVGNGKSNSQLEYHLCVELHLIPPFCFNPLYCIMCANDHITTKPHHYPTHNKSSLVLERTVLIQKRRHNKTSRTLYIQLAFFTTYHKLIHHNFSF